MSTQTSRPIRSASSSGPIGWFMPIFITASTASGVATPSITAKAASLISGISTRLETKPGASFTATGFFSSLSHKIFVISKVSSLVARPRITSTSAITGTGFMKCIPINFSGRDVCAASCVMEIEDVLLARITPGLSTASTSFSKRTFRSSCSGTASTAKSAAASTETSVVGWMRARMTGLSAALILSFFTSRSRFLPIVSSPRSRKRVSTSRKITL